MTELSFMGEIIIL